MAYIEPYTYDIFISYAHLDNETIFDQPQGWIQQFYDQLNLLLSRRVGRADRVKFWWDEKKLDGSMEFNEFIDESVRNSAILICLVSKCYLESTFCEQELQSFYNKNLHASPGLFLNYRSRIINVLINNIAHEEWPKELGGTTGFKFNDAKTNDDFGDPVETNSEAFKTGLKELRESIVRLFDEFK